MGENFSREMGNLGNEIGRNLSEAIANGIQGLFLGLGEAINIAFEELILSNVYLNGKKLSLLYKSEFINKDSINKNESNKSSSSNNPNEKFIIDLIYIKFGNLIPEDAEFKFLGDFYPILIFSKSLLS